MLSNTTQSTTSSGAPTVKRVVREIQSLLRSVAAAGDIIEAADTLAPTHPELAEFLRVYGAYCTRRGRALPVPPELSRSPGRRPPGAGSL